MLDVKAAVKVSNEYFVSIQDILGSQIQDLGLEEVETRTIKITG